MKKEVLKQIIEQLKKYKLDDAFYDSDEFKKWIVNLNKIQIDNFLKLNINFEEVENIKHLLINDDLLKCKDYTKRVDAISTLKNGDGCWHLYDVLCKPNFLKSKNFYKDIELLRCADTSRYGLWVLGDDNFINSPYHDIDLKMIVEAHDTNEERKLDFVIGDALATVAKNKESINSPYHFEDMKYFYQVFAYN